MKFTRTEISDVIIIEPSVFGDDRGYFSETFRIDKLNEFIGQDLIFCQDSESKSGFGVLRGLHFQKPPLEQTKIVRVIQGEVLDVAVDLRKDSPTFGKYVAERLSQDNKKQLFIPKGFAHGFVVLSESATLNYKLDNFYSPAHDSGISYTSVDIDWILKPEQLILSQKDLNLPKL